VFGDFFPVWGDFYESNYLGAFRLDQWLGIGLGGMVLIVVLIAVFGTLAMRLVQHRVWPSGESDPQQRNIIKLEGTLVAVAILIAMVFSFFPGESFIDDQTEPPYYLIPRSGTDSGS
jgi:heme/copper-type cytochrome/quinol oxidase subunit 2